MSSFRMKKLITCVIVAGLAWYGWNHYKEASAAAQAQAMAADNSVPHLQSFPDPASSREMPVKSTFSCDGRTHCSQMTSCEEAEYFLRNCPGTKMDGNNDGEPCESQWCGNQR